MNEWAVPLEKEEGQEEFLGEGLPRTEVWEAGRLQNPMRHCALLNTKGCGLWGCTLGDECRQVGGFMEDLYEFIGNMEFF